MSKQNAHPKPAWFMAGIVMAALVGACLTMDFESDEAIKTTMALAVFIGMAAPLAFARREKKRSYLFGLVLGGILTMMYIGRNQPHTVYNGSAPRPPMENP